MRVVSFLSLSSYFTLQIEEPHETEEFEVNTPHEKRGFYYITEQDYPDTLFLGVIMKVCLWNA